MLKLIKHLLADKAIYFAIFCSTLILLLSLVSISNNVLPDIKNSDKILHSFSYTILSLSWLFYFKPIQKTKQKLAIAFGVFLYGTIIEVLQTVLTTNRTGSLYDVLANTVGIFIALVVFETIYKIIFQNI